MNRIELIWIGSNWFEYDRIDLNRIELIWWLNKFDNWINLNQFQFDWLNQFDIESIFCFVLLFVICYYYKILPITTPTRRSQCPRKKRFGIIKTKHVVFIFHIMSGLNDFVKASPSTKSKRIIQVIVRENQKYWK